MIREKTISFFTAFLACVCVCSAANDQHYTMSRVDSRAGLSHSAVLSLYQDRSGLMWFGTYDGLDCYDGRDMTIFRSDESDGKTLSNNIIHSISSADGDNLWISNYLNLNRFSCESMSVTDVYDFQDEYSVHSNNDGDTWLILNDSLMYYNTFHGNFIGLGVKFRASQPLDGRVYVSRSGELWYFPEDSGRINIYSVSSFSADSSSVRLSVSYSNFHPKPLDELFWQDNTICFVDSDKDLYMYDTQLRSKVYIRNISDLIRKYGKIHGIIPFYEDIFIGFWINGLVRLCSSDKYSEEVVDKNMRIFDMYKDSEQGILWVGTDGKGAVSYAFKNSIATSLMLEDLSSNLSRQVRSIMTDKEGSLWFGTKGDGLICVPDYRGNYDELSADDITVYSPSLSVPLTSYVRGSEEFQVYDLEMSRYRDGFWVGTGSGLWWFSFPGKKLVKVPGSIGNSIQEIHSIIEAGPDKLYVATAGNGFHSIRLGDTDTRPEAVSSARHEFYSKGAEIDMFFQMIPDGDSLIWLGSRGNGIVRFDRRSSEYRGISLRNLLDRSVDDVLSLCKATDGKIYVGTTSGIVVMSYIDGHVDTEYIGRDRGLINDMVHGVLEDDKGFMWASTNKGLTKYNPKTGSAHTYYYTGGLTIAEFSDDAYYKSPEGELFFGGVNGLLWIDGETETTAGMDRKVLLRGMGIDRREVNMADYFRYDGDEKYIFLRSEEKISFSMRFAVPDFLNSGDIEYSYILEGFSKDWSSFSGSNEAFFYSVPPGRYVFSVRHRQDVFDPAYSTFSIPVLVRLPWYKSVVAKVLYSLIVLALILYLFGELRRPLHAWFSHGSKAVSGKDGIRTLDDRFAVIYSCCERLKRDGLSDAERNHILNIIRETVGGVFPNGQKFDTASVLPAEFVVSAAVRISSVSSEVLSVLKAGGTDVSSLKVSIAGSIVFPLYINAFRRLLYFCYRALAPAGAEVTALLQDDVLSLSFKSSHEAISSLGTELQKSFGPMMSRTETRISFPDSERMTLSLMPVRMRGKHEENSKRQVLLVGASANFSWLVCDLLSPGWSVTSVKGLDEALPALQRKTVSLLLLDMSAYVGREREVVDELYHHKSLIVGVPFVPMFTMSSSIEACKELILVSDAYMVLPHDILMLKNVVHKAVYGKGNIGYVKAEELVSLGGRLLVTNDEDRDFVEKAIGVIDSCLDREDLGTALIAGRMYMSPSSFFRKSKKIFGLSPEALIRNYRMEKAAHLLKDERISISDIITDIGISSRSWFYKEFSARFGMTPGDYREKFCSNKS